MQRRDPALRSSRAERVAADLEHEILTARLPVGAHLGRRSEIMDRFGISPTVMNETLRILRDRDLVTVRPGPGGGITVASAPAQVRLLGRAGAGETWLALTIHEGRKRQVRRMLASVGYIVQQLTRVAIGPLTLEALPAGKWRYLTDREVTSLLSQ